jgi:prepilin-type processing-associated H-X9-DG protein
MAEFSARGMPAGETTMLFLLENGEAASFRVGKETGQSDVLMRGNYHVATEGDVKKLVLTDGSARDKIMPFYLCSCSQSLMLAGWEGEGMGFKRISGAAEARDECAKLLASCGDAEALPAVDVRRAVAVSQNQMKQIGIILKMFANESRGSAYPPLSTIPGELMFQAAMIYPEYLTDPAVFINPQAPDAEHWRQRMQEEPIGVVSDQHYVYLGYAIGDEKMASAFFDAYDSSVRNSGKVPDTDISIPPDIAFTTTLYGLRDGISRFFITDINNPSAAVEAEASLPVFIERPVTPGANVSVLYLDGHVTSVPFGEFPNTGLFWSGIARVDHP